jgi:hypothetical protein
VLSDELLNLKGIKFTFASDNFYPRPSAPSCSNSIAEKRTHSPSYLLSVTTNSQPITISISITPTPVSFGGNFQHDEQNSIGNKVEFV